MLASVAARLLFSWPEGSDSGFHLDVTLGEGIAGSASGAFFATLIVGAILIAIAPTFTRSMIDSVLDAPAQSLAYGLISLVALVVLIIALFLTITGILFIIPLVLVAVLVWAVGSAIGFLAIAKQIVGIEDGWAIPLLLAAALSGGAALTGIGGLISFLVGAAGFGAVLREWL